MDLPMSSAYEIPRLEKHVLIALLDDTRIQATIFVDYPRSDAPRSEALANFLKLGKEQFIPVNLDTKQFFLINKNQILYIQETQKSDKDFSNTDFPAVMFYFPNSKLKANIHLNLASGSQRLSDALNMDEPYIRCYQYDCLTFVNKKQIIKVNQL